MWTKLSRLSLKLKTINAIATELLTAGSILITSGIPPVSKKLITSQTSPRDGVLDESAFAISTSTKAGSAYEPQLF